MKSPAPIPQDAGLVEFIRPRYECDPTVLPGVGFIRPTYDGPGFLRPAYGIDQAPRQSAGDPSYRPALRWMSPRRGPVAALGGRLRQAGQPRNPVEGVIERHDPIDPVALHDRHVEGVARGERARPNQRRGPSDVLEFDGEDLVDQGEERRRARLDRIRTPDRDVPMEDFLEHLGVGDEALASFDGPLRDRAGAPLQVLVRADELHRDVDVDEDHRDGGSDDDGVSPR